MTFHVMQNILKKSDAMKKLIERINVQVERTKRMHALVQFAKFGLVGISNTVISYGTELLLFYVILANRSMLQNMKVILTSACAFFISVTNSYIWNGRFVFRSGIKGWRKHMQAYLKTIVAYGVTGLIFSPVIKMLLVGENMPYYLASLISLMVTIPLNFLLNKYWTFKKK